MCNLDITIHESFSFGQDLRLLLTIIASKNLQSFSELFLTGSEDKRVCQVDDERGKIE